MIKRLLIVFGKPETADVKAYLEEVAKALTGYSDSVQDEACTEIMKFHKSRVFPTPAQCRKACEEVCEQRGQAAQRAPLPVFHPAWSKQVIAKADNLIRCDLGSRAANEGWILSLHDFCRNKQRLPVNHEIAGCMNSAKEFDNAYRQAQELGGSMGHSLVKLGNAMLARRDRCARVTDGEVLP